jgi:NADPH:quinone reductase-like Zn-dependent oxidoreductase
MHAVVMHETGDPDVMRSEEIDRPEPAEGEVLIKVHAASVNPADWKLRRGFMEKPLPAVLGIDVSGTVGQEASERQGKPYGTGSGLEQGPIGSVWNHLSLI